MKITKKSYNRRVLSFGVVMFLAIALISTGFATWVMSNEAKEDETGNISVGTITDGSLSFSDIAFKDNVSDFYFEPLATDQSGDIQYQNPDNDPNNFSENLEVTITGKVTPLSYLDKLTIQMNELPIGLRNAATAGYINLPECHGTAIEISKTDTNTSTADVLDFSYTIKFQWGSKFDADGDGIGENPSTYLDREDAKKDEDGTVIGEYTFEEKRDILIDLRRTIYNLVDTDEKTYTDDEIMSFVPAEGQQLTYSVVLTAKPNI